MSHVPFSSEVEEPAHPAIEPAHLPPARTRQVTDYEARNIVALAAHQVWLRVAWIFKTESVIIPAFLDLISGAGWVRGCLPWLNRMPQSVTPLLLNDRLRQLPVKKWALLGTTVWMALPFLALSIIWAAAPAQGTVWLPIVFLTLYALFFAGSGTNIVSFGTVQGKLVRAERRGRLMGLSGIVGSLAAISCAALLMPYWLQSAGGFVWIFGFTGAGFLVAALLIFAVYEPAERPQARPRLRARDHFRNAWRLPREDTRFRLLATVGCLFVSSLFLFPHYQRLGFDQAQLQLADLVWLVIAQNLSAGMFSIISGAIADRLGNRLALRILVFAAVLPPLFAVGITSFFPEAAADWYWVTFLLLGVVPIVFRTFANYTLEISVEDDHPRYLSTLHIWLAVPFLLSPLVGWLVDLVGFPLVFLSVASLVLAGGVLTFQLAEPRHDGPDGRHGSSTAEGRGRGDAILPPPEEPV